MMQKNLFNLKTHFPGLICSQALPILPVYETKELFSIFVKAGWYLTDSNNPSQ